MRLPALLPRLPFFAIVILFGLSTLLFPPVLQAEPASPASAAPEFLRNHPDLHGLIEDSSEFTIGGGYLYWSVCAGGGPRQGPDAERSAGATGYLRRWPLTGGRVATLSGDAFCDTAAWAADETGLYYVSNGLIMRRTTRAPLTPEPVMRVTGVRGRLVLDSTHVYWIESNDFIFGAPKLAFYDPDDAAYDVNRELLGFGGTGSLHLLLGNDGNLYWFANGVLSRFSTTCRSDCTPTVLGSDGGAHHLTGATKEGPQLGSSVYPMWANGRDIRGYWCRPGTVTVYTCSISTSYSAPTGNGYRFQVGRLATDGTYLFWYEIHETCFNIGCSPTDQGQLMRWPLSQFFRPIGPEPIAAQNSGGVVYNLTTDMAADLQAADGWIYFLTSLGIARVRVDAPPVQPDMAAVGVEVTQGIQNMGNGGIDVPMVADKPTYVRVYGQKISGPRANSVPAIVRIQRLDFPVVTDLRPLNGPLAFPLPGGDLSNRAVLRESWLFEIPPGWTYPGDVKLTVIVNPGRGGAVFEDNPTNNRLERTISFQDKAPVCLVFIPVRTAQRVQIQGPDGALAGTLPFAVAMAERLLPAYQIWTFMQTDDVAELEARFGIPPWEYGPYEMADDSWKVLLSLWTRDQFSDDPDRCDNARARTHYVGVVNAMEAGINGSGRLGGDQMWFRLPSSTNWNNPSDRAATLAHELGHNYGRRHVDCPLGAPDDPGAGYPYNSCWIDHDDGSERNYGFILDPATGVLNLILPTTAGDLMSYAHQQGRPRWTSDFTWRGLLNELPNGPTAAAAQAEPAHTLAPAVPNLAIAEQVVLLSGIVDVAQPEQSLLNYAWVFPTGTVSRRMVDKWQRSAAPARQAAAAAGQYHVRLLDAGGAVLDDREVIPSPEADEPGAAQIFDLTFPAPAGTVAEIVLLDGETVLTSRTVGPNPPVVTLLQPAGGEAIDRETTLVWTASDPDPDDALLFSLQYSPDNGQTWRALVTDLPNLSGTDTVTLHLRDLRSIPASTAGGLMRVAASDGYHTSFAVSPPFTVPNRPPQPFIVSPTSHHAIPVGGPVILEGGALDAEDGPMAGDVLTWTVMGSMVEAVSGHGNRLPVLGLGPGVYTTTLEAQDAADAVGTASAQFTVAPLAIPATGAPGLDGSCDDDAYATAARLPLKPFDDGSQATVFLVRTDAYLWACFSGLLRTTGGSSGTWAALRVDADHSRDATPQADDYEFFLYEDGVPVTRRGDGTAFVQPGPGGLDGRVSAGATTWNAELRIDAAVLGGWGHAIGLSVDQVAVSGLGDDYHWPYRSLWSNPSTWAATALDALPAIHGVSPQMALVDDAPFTLTVTGTTFMEGATVQWNGVARPTTFVDTTQIQAAIATADLAAAGRVLVTVANPGLVTTPSNAFPVTVNNPAPVVTQATLDGSTLAVQGANFVDGASLAWNGMDQPATFLDGSHLQAVIDPTLIPAAGPVSLVVMNPEPSAGASNLWVLALGEPGGSTERRLFLPAVASGTDSAHPQPDLVIYGDGLLAGWEDWSWDSTVDFDIADPVHGGSRAMAVHLEQSWAGLSLRAPTPVATAPYSAIGFWIRGSGGGNPLTLYVQATDDGALSQEYDFTAAAGSWTQVTVPLTALGSPAAIARITIQDRSGTPQPAFYLDDVRLAGAPGLAR